MGIEKKISSMERDLDCLLGDLCVQLGFCIPPNIAEAISKSSMLNSIEFAHMVLEAEGMNPEYEKSWVKKIAGQFRERFGEETSRDSY